MLVLPIPSKVRRPTLNPKQREVSSLNGKVGYLCIICIWYSYSRCYEESFFSFWVWNNYQTQTREWEIHERN